MSHISKIELEINDLEALKTACTIMGFNFMENQKTYKWFGNWVGDSPLPEGVKVEDLGKCTHAIKVPGAHYEIGVRQNGSKFHLIYDYWHSGRLEQYIGKDACKIKQTYTLARIRKEAQQKGYLYHEIRTNNGIRVSLTPRR
jgi:hypothetical protein